MEQEAREAPDAVQRFLDCNSKALRSIGERFRDTQPPFLMTSARGSSDHAASYLKYLSEIVLGIPCASVGASVASIYHARLRAKNAVAVTISQSGKSPDIVALQNEAKRAGAFSIALVNADHSPAGASADHCLPLCAGVEASVAATKSFIVSMAASAALVAHWADDRDLLGAVCHLPDALRTAVAADWPEYMEFAAHVDQLYVLGRGPSLPVAAETALKFKETCAIHAEAYSTAEVMHGPLELVDENFPVIVYAQDDASLPSTTAAIAHLRASGARALVVGAGGLPLPNAHHHLLEPILMIQSVYLAIEKIARSRGRNPDLPRKLKKITETV